MVVFPEPDRPVSANGRDARVNLLVSIRCRAYFSASVVPVSLIR